MKGKLYVTASGDLQLGDDVQSGGTEHLVLFISQGLGRSYYNTISGMHANRVDVFHVADRDHVSCTVTHYLVLDLFPAGDAAFYQNLTYTGETKTVLQDLHQFFIVVSDTAAAAAQGVRRTKHNRVAYLLSESHAVFYVLNNQGSCNGLADFLHGFFKFQTVLRLLDGLCRGTDEANVVLFQETCSRQAPWQGSVRPGLPGSEGCCRVSLFR